MKRLLPFIAALAVLLLCAAGCNSTIKGGSRIETEDHGSVTTGEQRHEDRVFGQRWNPFEEMSRRGTVVEISPDGWMRLIFGQMKSTTQPTLIETREETHVATTQPTVTTTSHTMAASTQPSASSPGAMPGMKFDRDGNATSIWFEPSKAVENLKARALLITPLILAAIAFFFFKRWLAGGVCLGCALIVALVSPWLVDLAFALGLVGGIGFVLYELRVKHLSLEQLKAKAEAAIGITPTPAADPAANAKAGT